MHGQQRMTSTICLSGWGQPHDALKSIAPHALHVDYISSAPLEQAFAYISPHMRRAHTVIGWSMGGLMACQMIARFGMAPKKLVLIATPFEFLASKALKLGMKHPLYTQFCENFARNPSRTFHKAYQLIAHGDREQIRLHTALEAADKARSLRQDHDWLYWLQTLGTLSCHGVTLAHIPEIILIHGTNDVVVDAAHSRHFAHQFPHAKLHMLENCGHAPHWHDAAKISAIITQ